LRKKRAEKEGQRKKREGKLIAIKLIVEKFISVQESGTGGERGNVFILTHLQDFVNSQLSSL
jgi:hypothetical protein